MKPKIFKEVNVVYGEKQEEYNSLPGLKKKDGEAVFCFELDEDERKKVLETGEICVGLLTFNNPLQPIFLTTKKEDLIQ